MPMGHGIEGIDRERGNGGNDHDGKHKPRRQRAKAKTAGQLRDKRADDDHAKETVDDGGDARQQVDGGADEPAHALAGDLDQIYSRAHTQGARPWRAHRPSPDQSPPAAT